MITSLTYELSVLAKAVQHKNLSAAAVHVGLSQPQLSRLVGKIEAELKIVLLDRSARRKSGWTPVAHDLALTFTKGIGRLQSEIMAVAQDSETTELRIGTLEGLSAIAMQFTDQCFKKLKIKTAHLDVLEYRELDSQFLSGNLDLIFTARIPSKQKFKYELEVGYQQIDQIATDKDIRVLGSFEYSGLDKKELDEVKNILVSNSLSIRKHWLEEIGGTGALPVDAKKGRGKGHFPIFLLGNDLLSPKLWTQIAELATT
jgi:LysR family transcriptional regulator, transcriptional activator for aaeXAB operon